MPKTGTLTKARIAEAEPAGYGFEKQDFLNSKTY